MDQGNCPVCTALLAASVKCQSGLHTSAPPPHTAVTEKAERTGGVLPEVHVKGHMLTGQREDQFSFKNMEIGYSVKKKKKKELNGQNTTQTWEYISEKTKEEKSLRKG